MEDEPSNLKLLSAILEDDYNILTALTGQEALDIVERETPDLIILDIMMPDIDGYNVCKRIRLQERTQLTPIIMITALTTKKDRINGIRAGADEFLSKPIDNLEVRARVENLIEKTLLHQSITNERNKNQQYLNIAGCMLIALDTDYNIAMVNSKCCDVLGYTEEELLRKNLCDLIIFEDSQVDMQMKLEELKKNNVKIIEDIESPVLSKDGERKLIVWRSSFIRDNDGNIEGILSSGNDITRERRNLNLLKERSEDLEFSNNVNSIIFDIMKHDFLAPVASLMTFVDSLLHIEDNVYKEQMLHTIKKTIGNMEGKIKETSKYTGLNSYKELDVSRQNIVEVLIDLVDLFEFEAQIKNVKVEMECQGVYNSYINDTLKDIFSNIISNSIQKSPKNSVIHINIKDDYNFWRIEFDYGESSVYEPNDEINSLEVNYDNNQIEYQSDPLGFSITKRLIELHGGKVCVIDKTNGKGRVFCIGLKKAE